MIPEPNLEATIKYIEYDVPRGNSKVRVPFLFDSVSMLHEIPLDLKDHTVKLIAEILSRRDAELKAVTEQLVKIRQEMQPMLEKSALFQKLVSELRKYSIFYTKSDKILIEELIEGIQKEKQD